MQRIFQSFYIMKNNFISPDKSIKNLNNEIFYFVGLRSFSSWPRKSKKKVSPFGPLTKPKKSLLKSPIHEKLSKEVDILQTLKRRVQSLQTLKGRAHVQQPLPIKNPSIVGLSKATKWDSLNTLNSCPRATIEEDLLLHHFLYSYLLFFILLSS